MALFEWRNNYTVNVAKFDNAHKKIIDLMNELHDIIKLKKDSHSFEKVLNELYGYTKTHFNDELILMEQLGYADAGDHKHEHEKFILQLDDIKHKLENSSNLLNVQLLYILKDWLITHIMGTDKKYSEFFNKNGIQ
ncbi:MAG: bacteriohemerythrin [Spirochaetia bacterium]|nr:bacteriohemerythrin [Spirochaetia bacterium]